MKKRIIIALFSIMMFLMTCGFRENENKVIDYGELLTDSEEEELQELCIETAEETELDIVILTTTDLGYKDAVAYADDFYDEGMYGYEFEYGSGVLFLICEDPDDAQVYISTAGLGILYIDDYDIEDILDAGWVDYVDYNYYDCLVDMIDETKDIVLSFDHYAGVEEVLDDWYAGEYRYADEMIVDYNYYGRPKNLGGSIFFCLIAAVVVSGITIAIMNSGYKNKMTAHGGTYFEKNSFQMKNNQDNFLRTTVSRVRIESSSGGGGGGAGGSSHRSSGGRSHGGGGRRR